jgi:hypothetical protein
LTNAWHPFPRSGGAGAIKISMVNKVVAAILTQAYFTAKQNENWDEAQIMKQVKEVFESIKDMISDS